MKKSREQLILEGKIWQCYRDASPDTILFEGSKTACKNFMKIPSFCNARGKDKVILGKLLWEAV
jgi:hypothetical protein